MNEAERIACGEELLSVLQKHKALYGSEFAIVVSALLVSQFKTEPKPDVAFAAFEGLLAQLWKRQRNKLS